MQKLDPHTLFSIFEKGDEEIYKEHHMEDVLKNPYVLMGMVVRGLENFQLMSTMFSHNAPEEYKKVKSSIKLKYYLRLVSYLERIDADRFEELYKIGESFEFIQVDTALNHLRRYFESIEMYEKCAIIKKYIDHLSIVSKLEV